MKNICHIFVKYETFLNYRVRFEPEHFEEKYVFDYSRLLVVQTDATPIIIVSDW